MQVIRIVVAVIVIVSIIWFCYDLYVCAMPHAFAPRA
jgi:hypothetical protein